MGLKKNKIVLVCGGFDPLHVGHVHHFERAKELGDKLVVVVNGDLWLKRKKGKAMMSLSDRMEIIRHLDMVDYVVGWEDGRSDISKVLEIIRPDILAKGGDRTPMNMPKEEIDTCKRLGIKIVYGVQGEIRSSSQLTTEYEKPLLPGFSERDWPKVLDSFQRSLKKVNYEKR